jgi:hypothetical protein
LRSTITELKIGKRLLLDEEVPEIPVSTKNCRDPRMESISKHLTTRRLTRWKSWQGFISVKQVKAGNGNKDSKWWSFSVVLHFPE